MKNNIEEIDQLIKEALTAEESKFYDSLEEPNIFQMILGIFSGKNGWLMVIMSIVQVAFFGIFIYSAVQFPGSYLVRQQLHSTRMLKS